jgi:hypothetical protein
MNDRRVKSKLAIDIRWSANDIYRILDFIGWNLQRPWNASVMKYLKENYEASLLPKSRFI